MAYYIKKGNIFGRVGSGFGEGLAQELPKAMEARNLQQGVDALNNRPDLDPVQKLGYLQSIGASPQLIQSAGELYKQQGFRNQYQQLANKDNRGSIGLEPKGQEKAEPTTSTPENQPAPTKTYKGQIPSARQAQQMQQGEQARGLQGQPLGQENIGLPGENPLASGNIPLPHWSPEKYQREKNRLFQALPYATNEQIDRELDKLQTLEQQQIADAQSRQDYINKQRAEIETGLRNKISEKLQPEGKKEGHIGAFEKFSPIALENIIRGAQDDLKENPEKALPDVIKEWSDKAHRFSKSMNNLDRLEAQPWYKTLVSKNDANRRLEEISKAYKGINNSEELFETLRTNNKFNFSTMAAAHYAFPESPSVKEYIDNVPREFKIHAHTIGSTYQNKPITPEQKAQKIAIDIGKKITDEDAILSILWSLNQRDSDFDSTSFMRQIQEDQQKIGLTDRQKQELQQPATEWTPRWQDFVYLPFFSRKR
jgi:hypothetical protein